jgi:hypothetical protein
VVCVEIFFIHLLFMLPDFACSPAGDEAGGVVGEGVAGTMSQTLSVLYSMVNGSRVTRLIAVSVLLAPLHDFIEDDITRDDDVLVDGVIAAVSLGPGLIPDENCLAAPVVELL